MRAVTLVAFLAVAVHLPVFAASVPQVCADADRVSIHAQDRPIREFLRDLDQQSPFNIAMDPKLRGRVTLSVSCIDLRTALKLSLGQIDAVFCESGNVMRVSRPSRAACSDPQPVVERTGMR